ncbi:tRNA-(ms[2]io[6]A)-hydroxylase [Permianibacter sp. IMCC34836]|uniref:tRNA-(ms[2]io[6]A)-hydroxylase n=1 Tax=Permianibacter fluminis TaxID=2738515 RepID=UPI00155360AD|nr:tRNA-(ms[2]io[6]A)-hydroxylase [Permianibacter fluminis]NQD38673.1 tRNA-(ms[2]io[6]A)-hydroxylase [Permianibacter fluminis]
MSLADVRAFLHCETPAGWLARANDELPTLLIDHAHCEKKAASTAMSLMHRFPERHELQHQLSRLAREELRHFEQVMDLMQARNVPFTALSPARYAIGLRSHTRKPDQEFLIDVLIAGAYIEARSCERFAALAEVVRDEELATYYRFLLRSESRHFRNYLGLAKLYAEGDITERVREFGVWESELILLPDEQYRFHSGVPV